MIRGIWTAALAAAVFFCPPLSADGAPWNFAQEESQPGLTATTADLGVLAFDALVGLYRANSDQDSVHRCLFHVSCSHFAQHALHSYGLVGGSVAFIDRYFYRENQAARALYPLIGESDGTYRLSDDSFVP